MRLRVQAQSQPTLARAYHPAVIMGGRRKRMVAKHLQRRDRPPSAAHRDVACPMGVAYLRAVCRRPSRRSGTSAGTAGRHFPAAISEPLDHRSIHLGRRTGIVPLHAGAPAEPAAAAAHGGAAGEAGADR